MYSLLLVLKSKPGELPGWLITTGAIAPFVLAAGSYIYHSMTSTGVSRSLFDKNTPLQQDSLLQACIYLSLRLINKERDNRKEKLEYIRNYFHEHFPLAAEDLPYLMRESIDNPIGTKQIAIWMKHKLNYQRRAHVMYFLFGLAAVDGRINPSELALLRPLADILEITPKDFESIYSSYRQKYEKSERKTSPRPSARQTAAKILGVSEHADKIEIKKAYRELVKKYHPDVYATESKALIAIAEERFLEIQKAYETLMDLL